MGPGGGPKPQPSKIKGDTIAAALSTVFQIDPLSHSRNRLMGLETMQVLLGGLLNLPSRFLCLSVSSLQGEGGTREKILFLFTFQMLSHSCSPFSKVSLHPASNLTLRRHFPTHQPTHGSPIQRCLLLGHYVSTGPRAYSPIYAR